MDRQHRRPRARPLLEWAAPALYLALALWVAWPLAAHPDRLSPEGTGADETLTQWFLAHTAYALTHLRDPFTTTTLGAPRGVNLAAQASMVGLGVPLAPITATLGAPIALGVLIVASPALTAASWYVLLHTRAGLHPIAAFLAALPIGFNPQELAEATGRNHVAMGALIPVIIWRVLRLARPQHTIRDATALGALIAWQALIGEEMLLIFTAALATFCATAVALHFPPQQGARVAGRTCPTHVDQQVRLFSPIDVRRAALTLGLAALLAAAALAYPLWRQFAGPGHLTGFPGYERYAATGADYLAWPWQPARLGLAALVLAMLGLATGWRRPPVAACAVVAGLLGVASLGTVGPWRYVVRLPLLDGVLPQRIALAAIAACAVLAGYGLDAALRTPRRAWIMPGYALLVAAAAWQLAPSRYPTWTPDRTPAFISAGYWRQYVTGGRTLVTVPVTSMFWGDGQRWATATGAALPLVGGYYLTSDPTTGAIRPGGPPTWTADYLEHVIATGQAPPPAAGDRARLLGDLATWRAGVLVLLPAQVHAGALREALTGLLGPPRWLAGVWCWDVRTDRT